MRNKLAGNAAALLALVVGVLGSAYAQTNSPLCNNMLIAGDYGFVVQGTKLGGLGPVGPQVGVAMAHFDGQGNFTQIDAVTINGLVVSNFAHTPAHGSYIVNSNCTGAFTIIFTDGRPPVVTNFVVVDNGNEIDTVVVSVAGQQGILATGSIGKRRFNRELEDND